MCHHLILLILLTFSSKFSVLREGVCRETRGGHTPPTPFLLQVGRKDEDAAPRREDRTGPGDEAEGCLQSQSANRRERRHHNQMVDRHI